MPDTTPVSAVLSAAEKMRFAFYNGPWENSERPTIVRDDPEGGDPHILATLARVHNPDALYELCRLANEASGQGAVLTLARGEG